MTTSNSTRVNAGRLCGARGVKERGTMSSPEMKAANGCRDSSQAHAQNQARRSGTNKTTGVEIYARGGGVAGDCEMLQELKRDPLLKRIPVVVLASSVSYEDIFEAYDLHANAYVCKPSAQKDYVRVLCATRVRLISVMKEGSLSSVAK
jgi:DNA-binding NarL/FixJ family response regulator